MDDIRSYFRADQIMDGMTFKSYRTGIRFDKKTVLGGQMIIAECKTLRSSQESIEEEELERDLTLK